MLEIKALEVLKKIKTTKMFTTQQILTNCYIVCLSYIVNQMDQALLKHKL